MSREDIKFAIADAQRAVCQLASHASVEFIFSAAHALADAFALGGKLLIAGNGGSLCDAMHFAEELTGFYRSQRPPLPALSLADPTHMSCVSNDVGFEHVYSRMVEALGSRADILALLSTSGNSMNLVHAAESAKAKGMQVITFLGKGGGKLKGVGDYELCIDGFEFSDRIQEAHMSAIHMIIEELERELELRGALSSR